MMATGQIERALVAFDDVIDRGIDDPYPYLLRGKALLAKGELDRAMTDLNKSLKFKPNYAEALAARGVVWSKKGAYADALADLDRSIAQEERVESYYARAQIQASQGNSDRALADFRRATELAPRSAFDSAAQIDARKRIEQLAKQVPCGGAGRGTGNATCL